MRVRSTGLGKTEMICEIASLTRQNGHLILRFRATEPTVWHIRIALTDKDILRMMKVGLLAIILYVLTGWRTLRDSSRHPGDF